MLVKDKIETKAEIVTFKFKVPKSYKDPLKTITNEDSFDEMETEEAKQYYNIFLGVPQTCNNE